MALKTRRDAAVGRTSLVSSGASAVILTCLTACRRSSRAPQGTASTLTRGEVRGGGKKPYKQKGTGNARRGSNVSPLFPGGGISFGPKVCSSGERARQVQSAGSVRWRRQQLRLRRKPARMQRCNQQGRGTADCVVARFPAPSSRPSG